MARCSPFTGTHMVVATTDIMLAQPQQQPFKSISGMRDPRSLSSWFRRIKMLSPNKPQSYTWSLDSNGCMNTTLESSSLWYRKYICIHTLLQNPCHSKEERLCQEWGETKGKILVKSDLFMQRTINSCLPTQPEIFTVKLSKLTATSYRLLKKCEKNWEVLAHESLTD